jgi:hypothetical protein
LSHTMRQSLIQIKDQQLFAVRFFELDLNLLFIPSTFLSIEILTSCS